MPANIIENEVVPQKHPNDEIANRAWYGRPEGSTKADKRPKERMKIKM